MSDHPPAPSDAEVRKAVEAVWNSMEEGPSSYPVSNLEEAVEALLRDRQQHAAATAAAVTAAVMDDRRKIADQFEKVAGEGPGWIEKLGIEARAGTGGIAMLLQLAKTLRGFPPPGEGTTALADLLAKAREDGVMAEREACAQLARPPHRIPEIEGKSPAYRAGQGYAAKRIAEAIRARPTPSPERGDAQQGGG